MRGNASPLPYPQQCAHLLVEEQAFRNPESPAVLYQHQRLTFGELVARSNHLAARLCSLGVRRNVRAGILLKSSPDMVVAMLAVLKAGGAFVPLDPGEPPARLAFIMENAALAAVLTTAALETLLPTGLAPVIRLDHEGRTAGPLPPIADPPAPGPTLDDEACILYTSGSTGHPKGVIRPHRAIVSRLAWIPFQKDDVFLHNMPLTAGFSQERLFLPLMQGLPLAMMPEDDFNHMDRLVAAVETHHVTHITLVPASLRRLLDLDFHILRRLRRLRSVAVGGSQLPAELARAFTRVLPEVELLNAYGATETGSVIRGPFDLAPSGTLTLGRPVPNATVLILDAGMRPVPAGEVGEMYIGAPSLAAGYVSLPELTAARFLANPIPGSSASRLYRTGDLARRLPNGEIEFHGRADRQVKIRSYRVELGEIEAALERHPAILEAAVTQEARGERLAAYIAAKPGAALTVGRLRTHLESLLPKYMLPASFVQLPQLPRMPGGKIDLRALPRAAAARPLLDVPQQAPRNALEAEIAEIWETILGIRGIGVHDNFLDLGGDSLQAARICVEIIERLDADVSPDVLFDPGTVAATAAAVASPAAVP